MSRFLQLMSYTFCVFMGLFHMWEGDISRATMYYVVALLVKTGYSTK